MFRSIHCDPEADFLPGIPSGEVVDSPRIERSLCDICQTRPTEEEYTQLAYETQEETADNDVGEIFAELSERENLSA